MSINSKVNLFRFIKKALFGEKTSRVEVNCASEVCEHRLHGVRNQ